MGITARFRSMPSNQMELERVLRETDVSPDDGTVTNDSFADRVGVSVIGRSASTSGKPSDIPWANGQFLVNRSGTLGGGTILDTDIPASIARDTEVSAAQAAAEAAAASALSAHVAASDPHPGYLTPAEGNAAYDAIGAAAAVLAYLPTVLGDYANDAAAATGGVAVGRLYHTSGAVKIRLS